MSQAFISYHHAQRKLARLIAHRVAADGHSVWWDRGDRPGDSWSEAVSAALARSACVVVIWSRQAASSPAILGEATAGYGRGALVNVTTDRTQPPAPFDSAPTVDLEDWSGDSIDVAWIRLREPIRAKMKDAEVKHVEGQPLPPQRPPALPPARAAFQGNPGPILPPPPPEVEIRRGPGAASGFMILALGGLAAAGWYFRDDLRQEANRWQAALEPQSEIAAIPDAPITPPPLPPHAATPVVETPLEPTPTPAETAEPAPGAAGVIPAATPTPRAAGAPSEASALDAWVPPPILRQLPRAQPAQDPPFTDAPTPAVAVAPAPSASPSFPAAPAIHRINLRMGRFVDIDIADPRRATDIWFAPDRSGDGLYLGVTNGARLRVIPGGAASAAQCARSGVTLRRTPVPARDLARGLTVCVRTSADRLRVVHVEGIEGSGREKVLKLRLDPPPTA
jgi:hypothetical protein